MRAFSTRVRIWLLMGAIGSMGFQPYVASAGSPNLHIIPESVQWSPRAFNVNPSNMSRSLTISWEVRNISSDTIARNFYVEVWLSNTPTNHLVENPLDPLNRYRIEPNDPNGKMALLAPNSIVRYDILYDQGRCIPWNDSCQGWRQVQINVPGEMRWPDGSPIRGFVSLHVIAQPVPPVPPDDGELPANFGDNAVANSNFEVVDYYVPNPIPGLCPPGGCVGTTASYFTAAPISENSIYVQALGRGTTDPVGSIADAFGLGIFASPTAADPICDICIVSFNDGGTDLTATVASHVFNPGTTYYFRWRWSPGCIAGSTLCSQQGVPGPWSTEYTWATTATRIEPLFPQDKAKGLPATSANLSWQGGNVPGSSATYDLYWRKEGGSEAKVPLSSTTSYTLTGLSRSTTYQWRMVSTSGTATVKGPTWSFTTEGPPHIPSAPSPGVGTGLVPQTTTLSWKGGDPDGDAVTYEIYFGRKTDASLCPLRDSDSLCAPVASIGPTTATGLTYNPGMLSLTSTYYWKIVARKDVDVMSGPTWWFFTTGNSFEVTPLGRNQSFPKVATDGNFSYLVVWQDESFDIRGALLDVSNGTFLNPDIPINVSTGNQNAPDVAAPIWVNSAGTFSIGGGGLSNYLVVWSDTRNGSADIYGALIRVTDGTVIANNILISSAPGAQLYPRVVYGGLSGNYFVVWMDYRSGTNYDIYGARVRVSDGAVLDPSGILVSNATKIGGAVATQQYPAVSFGAEKFLVTWEDARFVSDIYGARVGSDGVLLDTDGFRVSGSASGSGSMKFPAVTSDGTNFLAVWQDSRTLPGNDYDIRGTLVTPNGAVLQNPSIPISPVTKAQTSPSVAYGQGNYLVVWEDLRDDFTNCASTGGAHCDWNPYAAWVRPDGVVLDKLNISLTKQPYDQRYPSVAWGYTHHLVVWQDFRSGLQTDVYGQGRGQENFFDPGLGSDTTPPSIPGAVNATALSATEIEVSWVASTDNAGGIGVKSYTVYRDGQFLTAMASISYVNSGLTPNTTYTYTVAALDGDDNLSPQSLGASATTLSDIDLQLTAFSSPVSVKSGATISIQDSIRNQGTGAAGPFTVKYYLSQSEAVISGPLLSTRSFASGLASGSTATTPSSLTIPAGTPQGIYYVWMIVDADSQVPEFAESNNSMTLRVHVDDTAPLVGLDTPVGGSVLCCTVSVAASASDGLGVGGVVFFLDGIVAFTDTDGADGWIWAWDTTVVGGGSHTLSAKAFDTAGNVGTSATVTVQVDNTMPVISSIVASSITSTSATITWTTNETSDTQVEYGATTSYGTSTTLNASLVTSHSSGVSGLTASALYHYRVKSRDAAGNLGVSGDLTFTTAAPPDTTAPSGTVTINSGAVATNSTAVTLTLTCTDNVACTQMQIAPDGTANTEAWVTYAASTTTTLTTGNGTKTVAVRFRDAASNTSAQVTDTIILDTTAPGAPASLTATATSSTQINLSWPAATDTGGAGLADYRVERCTGASCTTFAQIATVTAPTTTYNNTGLTATTAYRYRVRARDAANNFGTYSPIATATTPAAGDTTPPVISAMAAGSVTFSGSTITWTTNEASDTQVEYGLTTSYGTLTVANPGLVTSHSQPLGSLSASTLYHYRVKSKDAAGNQATSGDATFTTGAVTGRLAWYRMEETGTITSIADASGNGRTATNAGAVSATGRIGNGFAFNGTTSRVDLPSIILNNTFTVTMWLYTTGSDTYANLFSQNGDIGLQYKGDVNKLTFWYNTADHVNTTTLSRNQWHHIALVNNAGSVTFYLDGVADGTATGAPGFSASRMGDDAYSENYAGTIDEVKVYSRTLAAAEVASEARFFSDTTPPNAPTSLTAAAGSNQINLSWTAPADTGGAGLADYRIERCLGSSCTNFTEIAAVTAPTTSYSSMGLTPSTSYRYQIRARDAANNASVYSSIVSATTSAGAAGLLAWYQMEETGTITNIADSSGNGRTATNAGAVSATGRIGNGFAFNGTTSRVDLPSIILNNTFTVAMWLYTTGSDTYANLFSQNGDIGLQYKGDVDKLTFWYNTADHVNNTAIPRNQWHHIAMVNNAGSVTFYLDGVADGTATGAPGFSASRMGDDAYSENYTGTIDEVKVYDRALTQAEVQAAMTGLP